MVTIRLLQVHPNCLVVNETCFSANDLVKIVMKSEQRTVTFKILTSSHYLLLDFGLDSRLLNDVRKQWFSFIMILYNQQRIVQ